MRAMRRMMLLGLAVAAIFGGAATPALAWEQCSEGGTTTKYETNQCLKAASGGKFSWQEVKGTENARSFGSLTLSDTKVPIVGKVSVHCSIEDTGSVGPELFGRVEKIEKITCTAGEHCEKVGEVTPENLPWQTEITSVEGARRDAIKATNGKGAGWAVTCTVLGVSKTDVCTSEEGTTSLENIWTHGRSGELLVLTAFDAKSLNAKCEIGGAGSGEVRGTDAILKENGAGLRIGPEGEERTSASEIENPEEKGAIIDMLQPNPFNNREGEVRREPEPDPGKGPVTNVGSCKIGNRVTVGGHCSFKQETPVGAEATFRAR